MLQRLCRFPATTVTSRLALSSLPKWAPAPRRWFATEDDDPPTFGESESPQTMDKQNSRHLPTLTQFSLYHAHTKPEFGCQVSFTSNPNSVFLAVRKQVGPKPVRGVKSTVRVFDTQKGTVKMSLVEASALSLFFGGRQDVFNLFHKANDGTTSTIKGQVKSRDDVKYWSLTINSEKYGSSHGISFDAAEARTLELYLIDAVRAGFAPKGYREEGES